MERWGRMWLLAWVFGAAAAAGAGEPEAAEEARLAEPAPRGAVRGRLTPPNRVLGAYLLDRGTDARVPVQVDTQTGRFEASGLPLGTYDLVVHAPWGRLEGVDMAPTLSDYDALVPPEYRTEDLGGKGAGPLTGEDLAAIRRHVFEVKRHENRIRELAVRGAGDRAVVLVELVLDRDFVGRRGDEIVWRVEQWYYQKQYGAWSQFRTRVLHRRRVSKGEWQTWGWQFEPALGGFAVTDDRPRPPEVALEVPEQPDPGKGLAGSKAPPADPR